MAILMGVMAVGGVAIGAAIFLSVELALGGGPL